MNRYLIKDTKSGDKTLIYCNSTEILLHSAYNPVKEAERNVASFNKGRSSIIIVTGIGLGFHIRCLKEKFPDTTIIAIEHDKEVVDLASEQYPDFLKDIPVICSENELPSFFEELNMSGFLGVSHYSHRPSYNIYRDFYDRILESIKQYISSKVSDLLTRLEFEESWAENIFRNVHHIFNSVNVNRLFGKFRNYPGIIVSAGPSLKKNAGLLKSFHDRALIVSVDTALKVLQKFDVKPHIVMTLDAQRFSIKHFLGLKNYDPVLLADIVSYPGILNNYKGKKIISSTSKYYINSKGEQVRETTPVMDWLENFTGSIGDIQSGGSVATSAFDLMLNLGCDPIIFVGQDLAYTGREIHSSGTYHNDEWLPKTNRVYNLDTINQKVIRKRKIKYISSFANSGPVITDFVLDLYKGWFEDSSGKVKQKIINATGGGAQIKNTSEMSLETILNNSVEKPVKPEAIIESLYIKNNNMNAQILIESLNNAIEDMLEISSIAEKSIKDASYTDIYKKISDKGLRPVLNPYLRRIETFIARHDQGNMNADEILNKNIQLAVKKIVPTLRTCVRNLKKVKSETGIEN